jgi:hypothetical protein
VVSFLFEMQNFFFGSFLHFQLKFISSLTRYHFISKELLFAVILLFSFPSDIHLSFQRIILIKTSIKLVNEIQMVPHWLFSCKIPLKNREMKKNTNSLNPQVASTDKYGNDFLYFSPNVVNK